MKILFVLSIGHLDGGAAQVWLSLISGLRERGHEPYVVMPQTKDETMVCALDEMNVPYWVEFFTWWTTCDERPRSLKRRLRRVAARRVNARADGKILQIILQNDIDCIVIEDGTIETGLAAANAAALPAVWHIHEFLSCADGADASSRDGESAAGDFGKGAVGTQHFLESAKYVGRKFAQADTIVCVSDAIRKSLTEQFPHLQNVAALHNGISDENIANSKDEVLQNDFVQFTMAQRFDENKDQLTCLEAFAIIANKYPQAKLQFVGDGSAEYIQKVKSLAHTLNCEEQVTFCGKRTDMAAVWEETDIAINCSHSEGCSISAAECMQSGCLHIASNCAGNVELLQGDRGLIFDVGNADSLAKQMSWALDNMQQACEVAQRGKAWALKEFDMGNFLDSFEHILHDVIEVEDGKVAL